MIYALIELKQALSAVDLGVHESVIKVANVQLWPERLSVLMTHLQTCA